MKYIWIFALIMLCNVCFVTHSEAVRKKQVGIETRIIEVESDFTRDVGTGYGHLDNWTVKEETDKVRGALDIYREKSKPLYKKKVWIIDKRGTGKKFSLDYETPRDKLIFTPTEDFVFWVGHSWMNKPVVYGRDLFSGRKFSVAQSDNFDLLTCRNKRTYVIIEGETAGADYYHVYDVTGRRKKSVKRGLDICNGIDF